MKKNHKTLKYLTILLSLGVCSMPLGDASDYREMKFNNRQKNNNANYHFNNYKNAPELKLSPLQRSYDFTTPKGVFIALLLTTYIIPVDAPCVTNQLMSKTTTQSEKKILFDKMTYDYHAADSCAPNNLAMTHSIIKSLPQKQAQLVKEELSNCYSIVNSWSKLKPPSFNKMSFSTEQTSTDLIVDQRYYAIADETDQKYTLMTANLMTCVGLALYNPTLKKGGLAHIDGENIRYLDSYLEGHIKSNNFEKYFLDISENTPFNNIDATLISGSSAHINYFKRYMENLGFKNIKIIHNPEWGDYTKGKRPSTFRLGSIAIDVRDGTLWEIENEKQVREEMGPTPAITNKALPLQKMGSK